MSTELDDRLRDSLEQNLRSVRPTPVDTHALMEKGLRARRVRRGGATFVGVVAIAAIALVATNLPGGDNATGSGPHTVAAQPGPPTVEGGATGPGASPGPRAVFVSGNTVHIGGKAVHTTFPGGTGPHIGRLGVAFPSTVGHRPSLLRNDGSVESLAPPTPAYGTTYGNWVAADSDSSLVAWTEGGAKTGQVVAYDTATHREIGRKTVPCAAGSGNVDPCPWPYIADDGLVFIEQGDGATAWNPRTGMTTPLSGLPNQAHHGVLDFFDGGTPVDISGLGNGWVTAKRKGEALLSYDGNWLVGTDNAKVTNWRDPSQTVTFHPKGTVVESSFDTDGSVLVVTSTGDPTKMSVGSDGRPVTLKVSYTGWDCTVRSGCKRVVGPTTQELRLIAWDT